MKKNIFKILIVGFLVIMAGLVVIASDIIVKQGDLTINKLTTAGSVGIGVSAPVAQLHVNRATEGWAGWIENSHTGGTDSGLLIKAGDDSSDTSLLVQNKAGASILKINGLGNVGIGTTTPGAKLHVVGNVRFASVGSGVIGTKDYVCIDSAGALSRSDTPCA